MMDIRTATYDDITLIRQMALEIWPVAYGQILSKEQLDYMLELIYDPSALLNQMKNLHHQFIIAEDQGKAVGFASFAAHNEDHNVFHLHKIYVLPSQQKMNTGKQLLNIVIENIKSAGATALQLNVNRHNSARIFYEKMDFKIICQEDIDIGNGYFMNDYVMELKLD